MRNAKLLLLVPFFFVNSCFSPSNNDDIEKWKSEIREVEKKFNDLAQKEGIVKAFSIYAAEDAVIKRNGQLVIGNEAIRQWYEKADKPNQTLTWEPDYVDVSSSGDLAYTYGTFVFSSIDSTGITNENTGKFHTVWKRQVDGGWKFVWD